MAQKDWVSYPPYVWYGVDAFNRAAEKVESGDWGSKELESLFRATGWGPASRSHAAAFLLGLAECTGIKELRRAGRNFETSGYLWQEVNEIWEYVHQHPESIDSSFYRSLIARVFKKIALVEEKAGNALLLVVDALKD